MPVATQQRRSIHRAVNYYLDNPSEVFLLRYPGIVPDPIEFCISDRYLNRPNLYPRQATLIKIITLRKDLLTDYDYDVIGEWTSGFWLPERPDQPVTHYEGSFGIQHDVLERMDILCRCPCGHARDDHHSEATDGKCRFNRHCRCLTYRGAKWFRQVEFVGGRRGSKGHTGGLCGAFVLWNFHCLPDPQAHYGVDRDKKLSCQVFAGKRDQARDNQWRDIVNIVRGAPCFWLWESKSLTDYYSVLARSDVLRIVEEHQLGRIDESTMDPATFTIEPKEATIMASRGPASFMQYYDEFAHIVRGVARVDGSELEDSAKPALDQFKQDAFVYQGSSPWTQQGRFYENYLNSLEVEPETKEPIYPEYLMVQFPSWEPYRDWERAHTIPIRKPKTEVENDGTRVVFEEPTFQPLKAAVLEFNEQLQREERANPDTFRVERRAQWATALDAYLNENVVARIWEQWRGQTLVMQDAGILMYEYRAHGDPSKSGANFGFAMAHREGPDERGYFHVVFDIIHHWEPGDFERIDERTGEKVFEIDYDTIAQYIEDRIIRPFSPYELTFDQWNSVATVQRLQKFAAQAHLPRRVSVYERPATAPLNWKTYETFKTALGLGLVHAPYYEKANQELLFLQKQPGDKVDHPTSGPVQTKDVADCMAIVTYELVGEQISRLLHESLADLSVRGTAMGGFPSPPQSAPVNPAGSGPEQAHRDLSNFGRSVARRGMPGVPRTRPGRRRR